MENRIRVGVLVFDDDRILLVQLGGGSGKCSWWVTPGGELQGDETMFQCAKREVLEETTLRVEVRRIAYLRQLIFHRAQTNSLEVFLVAEGFEGTPSLRNLKGRGGDEHYVDEVGFFTQKELEEMEVYPGILREEAWRDREKGFPSIKFIGIDTD